MGSVPRPHLGIASGILATMRNVGMVLGIATGGAVLYAFTPPDILQKAALGGSEAALFLSGLKHTYTAVAVAVPRKLRGIHTRTRTTTAGSSLA